MKAFTTALLLASSALAAPTDGKKPTACTFGTYQCTKPTTGIEICDIAGNLQLVGKCPDGTSCQELPVGTLSLPFCTNKGEDHDEDKNKDKDHDDDKDKDKDKDHNKDDEEDCDEDDEDDKDKDHDDGKDKDHDKDQDKDHDKDKNKNRPKPGDKCRIPGKYQCFGKDAIQVCDVQNILRLVGGCPETSHCAYLNGTPYCVIDL
jgi:hypothetical protein